jgi:hypothetical protein
MVADAGDYDGDVAGDETTAIKAETTAVAVQRRRQR